jgi:hypothetical protein
MKISANQSSKNINYILISLIFSITFVYIIPWVEIKGAEFTDLINYTNRMLYLLQGGTEREYNGISILSSEILWKYLLIYLATIFKDPYNGIYLISAISLFIYTFIILKETNNFYYLILLFNPMFIQLIMDQVRIAFAFSLFLLAYELIMTNKFKIIAYLIIIISPLIHTAMIIIISVFLLIYSFNKYFYNIKVYYIWAIITALFISLFLKFGADIILTSIGDKRVNYSEVINANSIKYSIFWFVLSVYIFISANTVKKEENNIIIFSLIMMCIFFFSSMMNAYGQRYVAISIPLIIISVSFLPKKKQLYGFAMIFVYMLLQFYYWIKLFNYI